MAMTPRQRWLLSGAAGASALLAVGTFMVARGDSGEAPEEVRGRLIAAGQRAYGELGVVQSERLRTVAEVRETLGRGDYSSLKGLPPDDLDEVLDELAGFVHARFAQPSADAYLAWRRERGYAFRPEEELVHTAGVRQVYRQATGREAEESESIESMFREVFATTAPGTESPWTMSALAGDAAGVCAVSGSITLENPHREPLSGRLGEDLWRGRVWGAAPSWFGRGPGVFDLLAEHDSLRYVDVGVVMEFGGGVRRPVVCTFIEEPGTGRWRLEYLMAYNYPLERLVPLAF